MFERSFSCWLVFKDDIKKSQLADRCCSSTAEVSFRHEDYMIHSLEELSMCGQGHSSPQGHYALQSSKSAGSHLESETLLSNLAFSKARSKSLNFNKYFRPLEFPTLSLVPASLPPLLCWTGTLWLWLSPESVILSPESMILAQSEWGPLRRLPVQQRPFSTLLKLKPHAVMWTLWCLDTDL